MNGLSFFRAALVGAMLLIPPALNAQSPDVPAAQPAEASPTPAEEKKESTPPAVAAPADRHSLVNSLGDAQIETATNALREAFVQPNALSDRELRRAQFAGLLERIGPGAFLEAGSDSQESPPKTRAFLGEVIDGRIGYIRPCAVDAAALAQMDALLADFQQKQIGAIVLDLRAVEFGSDFETAAEIARRFTPKGRLLFRVERPAAKQERLFTANQDPVFQGKIVVLIGANTSGAAEVLAGVLRSAAGALLIGAPTAGKPVHYEILPLGGGVRLRYAVAEAVVGEDQRIFPKGLQPDLPVESNPETEREIFRLSAEKGVSEFIFEKERPRMNEAALIANANPEIEAGTSGSARQLLDVPLQRAVDILTALNLLQP